MSVPVRDFLGQRRNRAVGQVMGHLERELFASLSPAERDKTRHVVLDAINGYHDSVLDLLKAEDSNSVRNDEVVEVLRRIEQAQLQQTRSVARR